MAKAKKEKSSKMVEQLSKSEQSLKRSLRVTQLIAITEEENEEENSSEDSQASIKLRELRKSLVVTDYKRRIRNSSVSDSMSEVLNLQSMRSSESRNHSIVGLEKLDSHRSLPGLDSIRSRSQSHITELPGLERFFSQQSICEER